MKKLTFSIEGMTCGHCVKTVEAALKKVSGIESAKVVVGEATVTVAEETDSLKKEIETAISEAGYKVKGFGVASKPPEKNKKCCC